MNTAAFPRMQMPTSTPYRLRKHADYQRIYKGARKRWAQQIAYFSSLRESGSEAALRSETPGPRVGLTVPRALGKAVDRNRIKRRLRELVRKHLPLLQDVAVDVILHPKRSVLTTDAAALEREVAQIFRAITSRFEPRSQTERGRNPALSAAGPLSAQVPDLDERISR